LTTSDSRLGWICRVYLDRVTNMMDAGRHGLVGSVSNVFLTKPVGINENVGGGG